MAFHRHHRDDGTFDGTIISGAPFRATTFGEPASVETVADAVGPEGVDGDDSDDDVGEDEHRNNEHVVTLTSVPTRFGCDVVVAELESCGIKAGVVGRRIVVFERDLATARAIIAQSSEDQTETGDEQAQSGEQPVDSGEQ